MKYISLFFYFLLSNFSLEAQSNSNNRSLPQKSLIQKNIGIDTTLYTHIILENCLGQSRNLLKDKDACFGQPRKNLVDVLQSSPLQMIKGSLGGLRKKTNNKGSNNPLKEYADKQKPGKRKYFIKDPKHLFLYYKRTNQSYFNHFTKVIVKDSKNNVLYEADFTNTDLREELDVLISL